MSGGLILSAGQGGGAHFPTAYVQASHSVNFVFDAINTGRAIPIDTNDEIQGIDHDTGAGLRNFTVLTDGVYVVAAQPQVLGQAAGVFHMWLAVRPNGAPPGSFVDVPNSNVELTLPNNQADVIPLITAISLSTGDQIRAVGSVSDLGIILEASAPVGEPAIPSIIFTMYRIF